MSDSINQKRRELIKFGLFSGLTLFVSRVAQADDLLDQIGTNSANVTNNSSTRNQIISVRIWPSDVYTRLTIEGERSIQAKYFNLQNPNRFVIDILGSELNAVLKNLSNNQFDNDPIISSIKVGQFDPTTVRIVVYAKQSVSAQTQSIPPVSLGGVSYKYRYVFDMYPSNGKVNQSANKLDDQLLAFLQLNADDHPSDNSGAPNTSSRPTTTRTQDIPVISEPSSSMLSTKRKGQILVMIDPGHGGEDPGAIGALGTKEKNVVLDIGKKLRDLINDSGVMQAQMTRNQDIFIPLATRVAIARKAKADIFVSIHADAFSSPAARGSSVFVLSEQGASSAFAKYIAVSQNNADLIGGMSFQTRDSIVSKILLDMAQGMTMRNSTKLGQIVLNKMGAINKLHNNNIERAGFAVLKAPDIPSILVESAFVSNPTEEELLMNEDFRQKVAQQIFAGLQQYAKQNIRIS